MSNLKEYILVDHLVSGEEFKLLWNENHQCYQTCPVPESPGRYYESSDYISHSDRSDSFISRIYQRAKRINLRHKLRLVEKYAGATGRLMDVGAGTGDFVKYAQERDWEAYGVEPNDTARNRAHEKGVAVYSRISMQKDAFYDVITMWHVLEHLPDLQDQIQEISKTLRPGGVLILAVPNYRSLDAKFYKADWAAFDVPRHIWHFSKASIKHIFAPHGYELQAVKPLLLDAFYISWLSETYRQNKLAPFSGGLMGLASNLYGMVSREFSSHVYVLKKTREPF